MLTIDYKEVSIMEIKVLGPGCANCHVMEQLAKTAVSELGIDAKVEKISDIQEIMKYTMSTPGLVVNGKLKHSGKPLPSIDKVKALIKEEA
jgi:small redox-active disulfide protein 2